MANIIVLPIGEFFSRIAIDPATGTRTGAADKRRDGKAVAESLP